MRSKKIKFYYIAVTMALTMSFFLIGVYSAANREAKVTGSLSFTASYVWVNYKVYKSDPYSTGNPSWVSTVLAQGDFDSDQNGKTASLGDLDISDALPKIAIKITFTKLTGFTKKYYIKTTLPSISGPIASITVNNNDYISQPGLEVGTSTGSIELVYYFTAVSQHNFLSQQNFTLNIPIDLKLTAFT